MKSLIACILLVAAHGSRALAQVLSYDFAGPLDIPDGSSVGASMTGTVPDNILISSVRVRLELASDFNGDLYIQINHGGNHAVLLNRAGRTASSPFGYGDRGFDIALSDDAILGDVHQYRLGFPGGENTPLATPLAGT